MSEDSSFLTVDGFFPSCLRHKIMLDNFNLIMHRFTQYKVEFIFGHY